MRRSDREIAGRKEMEEVISRCRVCHLALSSPEGRPYAVALNFGYAPGDPPALYFHCARAGKKLELLRQNPRCAFIIDRELELVTGPMACDWSMKYESVMGTGAIGLVADPAERRLALDRIMAQYGNLSPAYGPELAEGPLILKLTIEELTGKQNT
jgi:nitroimidazol reductase NimA-like FMN-containing flavoprotein (pyridoxamine 5'-phosphate oxidase superfamily)